MYGILYLTDVTVDTAPTYVVDRAAHLGLPLPTDARKGSYDKAEHPGPNWNTLHELMVELDPRQRHLLGFPPPGDDHWTDKTIGHLERMCPGIDSKPYLPPTPAQVPAQVAR
ncbi:hypothetical protein OG851_38760 [Streptomyces sp. NBC_00161]|uniref:hypothetical protein n=1 Tax=Streptomyces sp. NBC_00161 TaxID=2975671 RepID=UPI00324B6806